MRGRLITTVSGGQFRCKMCGVFPPTEVHTAQGDFWLVPSSHNAPCGQPCIGGGLEAPFRGHAGTGKCSNPECKVKSWAYVKPHEASIPTWLYQILIPLLK